MKILPVKTQQQKATTNQRRFNIFDDAYYTSARFLYIFRNVSELLFSSPKNMCTPPQCLCNPIIVFKSGPNFKRDIIFSVIHSDNFLLPKTYNEFFPFLATPKTSFGSFVTKLLIILSISFILLYSFLCRVYYPMNFFSTK